MGKLIDNLKFVGVAGIGLYGDGWLNVTIGLIVPMIGYIYYQDNDNKVPTVPSDVIKGGLSLGMMIGQIGFGLFGDALGRHKVYGKELMITILGTLLLIVMPPKLNHTGVVGWLTTMRIITGIGIGGDYPMTSSISAESRFLGSRAQCVLTVFASLGLGAISASITFVVLLSAFHSAIDNNVDRLQWVWRLLFGIGLVPLLATLYARLVMKESTPYEKYVSKDTGLVGKDKRGLKAQLQDFKVYFSKPKHARTLFAICAAWFLFDIAFYGINLNQSIILSRIGYATGATPYERLWNLAIGNIIVQSAGYLPGYYIGIFLPDRIGRIPQQAGSSIIVAVLYAIWAGVSNRTSTGGLITLFALSQLFLNLGPNCTTFLLPVEVFPTRVRGTAHGIAAAVGKSGAVLTAFAFGTITDHIGLPGVLGLFSGIMFMVAAVTFMIPETKGRTIEEIEFGVLYGEKLPESGNASFAGDSPSEEAEYTKESSETKVKQAYV